MQNAVSLRPRRAFLRLNAALSICALGLVSLTMASKAKEALALGSQDGVCANVIGSANCPDGWTDGGFVVGADNTTCHASTVWYSQEGGNPYYNCCTYLQKNKRCIYNGVSRYHSVEYFRENSNANAACFQGMYDGPNHHCEYIMG